VTHTFHSILMSSGATQLPLYWVFGGPSLGIKQPEHEAEPSSPSAESISCLLAYMPRCLIRHRDSNVRFEVFSAGNGNITVVFSDDVSHSLVGRCQCFGEACYLHLQDRRVTARLSYPEDGNSRLL
jgi:hypothetical protein